MIKTLVNLFFLIFLFTSALRAQEKDIEYFITQGFTSSPLLKDLNNQLRTNSYDSLLVKASFQPQVNVNTSLMYAPIVKGYGYSEPITNGQQFLMQIAAGQAIFNSKAKNAQYHKFGIENQGITYSVKISKLDLKKAIISQYLTVYGIYNETTFRKNLIQTGEDEEKILKELVNQGYYKQTDYLSFLLELQSITFELTDYEIQYRKELSNLKILCGINDTITYQLKNPDLALVPASGYVNPVFFQRFKIDSLRLENEKVIINSHYKPQVNWFTDAGLVNNEPRFIYQNFGVSIGISLALPVYDGNQRKLSYEKLKVSEETRKFYRDFFASQYDQQISQLNSELRLTMEVFPKLGKQLELSEDLIRQDKVLLNTGGISVTDYILALKNEILFKNNINQYRIRILQIINEINYWREK
ncbi:MAG: TolC family protein [Bacteroidetes bacterium]|nr:TolC family protein [Bacteroidota bacterium]